ncbi:MAG TPA: DUF4162 domain-containing protein, partial [Blastocatellia bacterium]|nr:DUF4162 domain-containing protein [Blastocatellia bacterium]
SALANNQGLTILLTTHYLEEADRLARRVGIVDSGRLVVEGHPEKLKGELSGDAIDIETAEDGSPVEALEALAPSALARVERIREVTVAGRSIYARADHGATAVPSMLAALEAEGIRVASVKVARPSLDDVYLRYTGRRFSEADQAVKTVQGGAK